MHTCTKLTVVASLFVAFLNPLAAAAQGPEEILLLSKQAVDLAEAALSDAVEPVGGLLGRISPSSSYASVSRGFGYAAISLGATGLEFKITDPDYTNLDAQGQPGTLDGFAGAVFADIEIGLFSGYGRTTRAKNIGSLDLLVRLGATIGDQDNLADEIDLGSLKPIYGVGFRLGILRGRDLPAISLSGGVNHFLRRSLNVLGDVDGTDFEVGLQLEQTSAFFLLEVAKQWGPVIPFVGAGVVRHTLDTSLEADVVYDAANDGIAQVARGFDFFDNSGLFFGGLELGSQFVRVVAEVGSSSSDPYATFYFKFLPIPGYSK